jgi:hypothetical protein
VTQRVIHVGIGVFGKRWCSDFLKTNVADGTDRDRRAGGHRPAGARLWPRRARIAAERCYTDPVRAFAETKATSAPWS